MGGVCSLGGTGERALSIAVGRDLSRSFNSAVNIVTRIDSTHGRKCLCLQPHDSLKGDLAVLFHRGKWGKG